MPSFERLEAAANIAWGLPLLLGLETCSGHRQVGKLDGETSALTVRMRRHTRIAAQRGGQSACAHCG